MDTGNFGQNDETYSRIFELLSCHKIYDAIELSEKSGLYRLSTLLNQIGEDNEFINLISLQLDQWTMDGENEIEFNTIPKGLIDIYRLLGSDPFPSNNWNNSIFKNIGWLRGLSMIYWYCNILLSDDGNSIGTLTESLSLYDDAMKNDYIDKPLSPYTNDKYKYGSYVQYPDVTHGLYSLLHVLFRGPYVDCNEMEMKVINSLKIEGYTRDPLDYRSVYIILLFLESTGIVERTSTYSCLIRQHFISQLINEGSWIWGVFIALQLTNDKQRSTIVKEMILRYAIQNGDIPLIERTHVQTKGNKHNESSLRNLPNNLRNLSTTDEINFLVDILHIPIRWIYESAAHRNGYNHHYIKQVQYLNYAELWCNAKTVVCDKLVPLILLKSKSTSIILLDLLESMSVENDNDDDDIYHSKSNIILSFLRLKSRVDNLINKQKELEYDTTINGYGGTMDMNNDYNDIEFSLIIDDLSDLVCEAKLLLKRIQILTITATTNTIQFYKNGGKKPQNGMSGPHIEYATLLNMGTYLFDLIDRLTWYNNNNNDYVSNNNNAYDDNNTYDNNKISNLYEPLSLFENSLDNNFPVQGNHILHSLHHHSSSMLKQAANHLSESYRISNSATSMMVE